jgi:hypothetical protein
MRRILTLVLLLLSLGLTACGGGRNIYIEETAHDPDDTVMVDSITAFLKITGAPVSSSYEYTRVDLNADKRRDALVLLKNPYGRWCDINGCTMLVLRANDDSFSIVNEIRPVRGPLYVSPVRTNGWNDIIMRVDGRRTQTKDVAIRFDGKKYPADPSALPPTTLYLDRKIGQRVFP